MPPPSSNTPYTNRFLTPSRPARSNAPPSSKTALSTGPPSSTQSSSQFANKPRFLLSAAKSASSPNTTSSPVPRPRPTPARRVPRDAIVDADAEIIDIDALSDGSEDAHFGDEDTLLSIEAEEDHQHHIDLPNQDSPSAKRRRLSLPDAPSPRHSFSHPPASPPSTASRPRFLFRPPPPPSPSPSAAGRLAQHPPPSPAGAALTGPPRPSPFIIPSRPPDEEDQAVPVPEHFSPRSARYGQKYVPGGLAAGVREWVVALSTGHADVGITAPMTTIARDGRRNERAREKEKMAHVRVAQVRSGEGMHLVSTREGERWILMRYGETRREAGAAGLEEGVVVGIRPPFWETELDVQGGQGTQKWWVGLGWSVLG